MNRPGRWVRPAPSGDRRRLAGRRFSVPMSGTHVRRVFDEWCRRS